MVYYVFVNLVVGLRQEPSILVVLLLFEVKLNFEFRIINLFLLFSSKRENEEMFNTFVFVHVFTKKSGD